MDTNNLIAIFSIAVSCTSLIASFVELQVYRNDGSIQGEMFSFYQKNAKKRNLYLKLRTKLFVYENWELLHLKAYLNRYQERVKYVGAIGTVLSTISVAINTGENIDIKILLPIAFLILIFSIGILYKLFNYQFICNYIMNVIEDEIAERKNLSVQMKKY